MEKRANEMEIFVRARREIKVKTWHPQKLTGNVRLYLPLL